MNRRACFVKHLVSTNKKGFRNSQLSIFRPSWTAIKIEFLLPLVHLIETMIKHILQVSNLKQIEYSKGFSRPFISMRLDWPINLRKFITLKKMNLPLPLALCSKSEIEVTLTRPQHESYNSEYYKEILITLSQTNVSPIYPYSGVLLVRRFVYNHVSGQPKRRHRK